MCRYHYAWHFPINARPREHGLGIVPCYGSWVTASCGDGAVHGCFPRCPLAAAGRRGASLERFLQPADHSTTGPARWPVTRHRVSDGRAGCARQRGARWLRPGLPGPVETLRGARNGLEEIPEIPEVPDEVDGALGELPSLLARSASGLEFIYSTLDLIAARYRLRDLVVVVAQPDKPHIFRLGQRPGGCPRGPLPPHLSAALTGREGLYADPPIVGPVAAACVTSLVELALRMDLLVHDASHDSLTGLLNRRSYELLLGQAVSRARRYGWPFALVLLDLDNFKVVNDQYGHAAGDSARCKQWERSCGPLCAVVMWLPGWEATNSPCSWWG